MDCSGLVKGQSKSTPGGLFYGTVRTAYHHGASYSEFDGKDNRWSQAGLQCLVIWTFNSVYSYSVKFIFLLYGKPHWAVLQNFVTLATVDLNRHLSSSSNLISCDLCRTNEHAQTTILIWVLICDWFLHNQWVVHSCLSCWINCSSQITEWFTL